MAELKFSDAEDNLLITLIEQNKPLHDPECETYKDVGVRDDIWNSIALCLDKTDEECRKRWKHIRDSYNRHKRKRRSGTAARTRKSKWQFFQRLTFLEKEPVEGNTEGIIHDNSDSDNVSLIHLSAAPDRLDDNVQDIDDTLQIHVPPQYITEENPSPLHKKRKFDEFIEVMKQREENRQKFIQEVMQLKLDETDDDCTFGTHVKTVLKKLTPRFKIQAKKEIFDILMKYETLNLDLKDRGPDRK